MELLLAEAGSSKEARGQQVRSNEAVADTGEEPVDTGARAAGIAELVAGSSGLVPAGKGPVGSRAVALERAWYAVVSGWDLPGSARSSLLETGDQWVDI